MKITDEIRLKVREAVVKHLTDVGSAPRAALMNGVMLHLGLTAKEMADRRGSGKYYTLRSYVGVTIDQLEAEGSLRRVEHCYTLMRDGLVIVEEGKCREAVIKLLGQNSYTKKQLFEELDAYFGTDKTDSKKDNDILHSAAGSVLSKLLQSGAVTLAEDKYSLTRSPEIKTGAMTRDEFKKSFLERLHSMGGPFFEHFLANLFEKYFTMTGRTVLVCEVSGGSSDGGVDVVVDTVDDLGFYEHILVQAKCRARMHVTEKEVREFYGALTALSGSRGIYATTSIFHEGAQRLLKSLDNCVGIDGDKLFELIEMTSYGIIKGRWGYRFDENIFVQ